MSFRSLFITQEDPFYVRIFFEEYFSTAASLDDVAGVVIAPTMGRKTTMQLARQMYDFYGPMDFVRMTAKYVWHKLAVKLPWTGRPGSFYSIEQVCRHFNVPVIHTANVNDAGFLRELRSIDPDLIVSVAAPQIFKSELIALPRKGCINIHNSRLPKYRGMLPNFWQMYHGESTLGATVHRINAKLDDGPILAQHDVPAIAGESLDQVICRTKRQGAALMRATIEKIRRDETVDLPNPKEASSHYTFPTKDDVREFRQRGYRLL